MYQEHSAFEQVEDDLILWKYMNPSKFIWMLEKQALWFSRIDCFEDVFEGSYPVANKEQRPAIYRGNPPIDSVYNKIMELAKAEIFACCFHASDFESAAMWKLYAKDEGVAIKTDVRSLKLALSLEPTRVWISKVKYIDYDHDFLPERNMYSLALYKRKSFAFENELRCLWSSTDSGKMPEGDKGYTLRKGELISISCNSLIHKVFLSPFAPPYMEDVIRGILERYKCPADVMKSPLYTII